MQPLLNGLRTIIVNVMRTSKNWILATFPMNPNNLTQKTFNILFFRFPQGTCTMPFQMFLQIACRSIVALAAIVWFSPIVCFQMSSQIACLRAYKITFVAFVICLTFPRCGFSNVSSNCLPQRMHNHIGCIYFTFHHYAFWNVSPCACIRWCKVTLIAFVWLFSSGCF